MRDRVEYGEANPMGPFTMLMDMAFVIRTKYHTFTFSRGTWFDASIAISIDDAGASAAGIGSVEDLWLSPEDVPPTIQRETIAL